VGVGTPARALTYEQIRIGFMAGTDPEARAPRVRGRGLGAFQVTIDVEQLVRRLAAADSLDASLCRDSHIVLSRRSHGAVRDSALDDVFLQRLRAGQREAVAAARSR
jgi:hypothetical protein